MPLPPGHVGIPPIGETRAFTADPFGFIATRVAEHGPVFRTHVAGRHTVVVAGPEGTTLFSDPAKVKRAGALPHHVCRLFGLGASNQLDGEDHLRVKTRVLAAMSLEALQSYSPAISATVRAHVARWRSEGTVSLVAEARRLAFALVADNVFGVSDPRAVDRLMHDYTSILEATNSLPINLPFLDFGQGLAARDRAFATYTAIVQQRRSAPTRDGVSRILAAEGPGAPLSDAEVVKEMHHLVVAGFIVYAWMVAGVTVLHRQPGLVAPLRSATAGLEDAREQAECVELVHFVDEVRRTTPVIPAMFGLAATELSVGGYAVPEGWQVMWGVHASHNAPRAAAFTNPERFDPRRFSRGEQSTCHHAFAPQGGGPPAGHLCAGVDYSGLLLRSFFAEWLRGGWTVPTQDLELDPAAFPPEPRDGLRVRFETGAA